MIVVVVVVLVLVVVVLVLAVVVVVLVLVGATSRISTWAKRKLRFNHMILR